MICEEKIYFINLTAFHDEVISWINKMRTVDIVRVLTVFPTTL